MLNCLVQKGKPVWSRIRYLSDPKRKICMCWNGSHTNESLHVPSSEHAPMTFMLDLYSCQEAKVEALIKHVLASGCNGVRRCGPMAEGSLPMLTATQYGSCEHSNIQIVSGWEHRAASPSLQRASSSELSIE